MHYPEILQRVKDGQKLLDLGCCFGQDERRLVSPRTFLISPPPCPLKGSSALQQTPKTTIH